MFCSLAIGCTKKHNEQKTKLHTKLRYCNFVDIIVPVPVTPVFFTVADRILLREGSFIFWLAHYFM